MAALFFTVILTGCATTRTIPRDPFYDGGELVLSGDSTTFIRIKIENHRTKDDADPRIYVVGSGSHSLGVIGGINGKIDRLIDTRWLGPDGCLRIVAHYVGLGDLVFSNVCWRPGEFIEAALDDLFNPNTAWSHR